MGRPSPLTTPRSLRRSGVRTVELDVRTNSLNLIRLGAGPPGPRGPWLLPVRGRDRTVVSRARTSAAGRCSASSPSAGTSSPRAGSPTRSGGTSSCESPGSTRRSSCAWSSPPASSHRSRGPQRGATGAASSRRRPAPPAYVLGNLALRINAYDVAGTPSAVPYPGAWNGSLWTLYFEFLCYLLVGLAGLPARGEASSLADRGRVRRLGGRLGDGGCLGSRGILRRRPAGEAVAGVPRRRGRLGGRSGESRCGRRSPSSPSWWRPSSSSCPSSTGALRRRPRSSRTCCSGSSTVLPSPAVARRHDISYGVYIYAFPMQQLLVYAGAHRLGLVAYDVLAALATAAVAVVSWRLVERPALRWARHRFRSPPAVSASSHGVPNEWPAASHRRRATTPGSRLTACARDVSRARAARSAFRPAERPHLLDRHRVVRPLVGEP